MTEPLQPAGARRAAQFHDADDDITSFGGAIGWTLAGTIIPGIGFLRARRWFEGVMTLIFLIMVLGIVGFLLYERDFAKALFTSPITLSGIAVLCGMLAILLTGVIAATYLVLRPRVITPAQRIGGALVVFVLTLLACAPFAIGVGYALSQARIVS